MLPTSKYFHLRVDLEKSIGEGHMGACIDWIQRGHGSHKISSGNSLKALVLLQGALHFAAELVFLQFRRPIPQ